jgi:4-hydroxy-3-methylbut-2-enyl diphosphate reductase
MIPEAIIGSEISKIPKRLLVGEPRGLCAGVVRSLKAFDQAIEQYPGQSLYSVGEPAHNTQINNRYRKAGIVFVGSVGEVPVGGKALLGPHGTEVDQIEQVKERGLTAWDTTCPLVTKVEDQIIDYTRQGFVTIYWGDPKHQEAKSAISSGDVILVTSQEEALSDKVYEMIKDKNGVAFASQTTFNADEAIVMEEGLRTRYPKLVTPKTPDRCYATRNRQTAVKKMIEEGATFIVIVGSPNSSNSRRLHEVAIENGAQAVFVDSADELDVNVLANQKVIGFESGASVEEDNFQKVVDKVKDRCGLETEPVMAADESRIRFAPVKAVNYKPEFIHTQ